MHDVAVQNQSRLALERQADAGGRVGFRHRRGDEYVGGQHVVHDGVGFYVPCIIERGFLIIPFMGEVMADAVPHAVAGVKDA